LKRDGLKPTGLSHTTHTKNALSAIHVFIELYIHGAHLHTDPTISTMLFIKMKLKQTDFIEHSVKSTQWAGRFTEWTAGENTPDKKPKHPKKFIIKQISQSCPEIGLKQEHGNTCFYGARWTKKFTKPRFTHSPLIREYQRKKDNKKE
jgi:hypothetical protein